MLGSPQWVVEQDARRARRASSKSENKFIAVITFSCLLLLGVAVVFGAGFLVDRYSGSEPAELRQNPTAFQHEEATIRKIRSTVDDMEAQRDPDIRSLIRFRDRHNARVRTVNRVLFQGGVGIAAQYRGSEEALYQEL